MKKKLTRSISLFLILMAGMMSGILLRHNPSAWSVIKWPFSYVSGILNTEPIQDWGQGFRVVSLTSSVDGKQQKANLFASDGTEPRPLIVNLHTWSGDYTQFNELASLCRQRNLNYIHPDFRGPNISSEACCSPLALSDIDDAVDYALTHTRTDTSAIFVVGVSGGGYATLCTYMKSKHRIHKFSAWSPISDLVAWHHESSIRGYRFARDILDCTDSGSVLDTLKATGRSPLFWQIPENRLETAELKIYTGIYDGIQGSVPITHSIHFYNKVINQLHCQDTSLYVTGQEILKLFEGRKPLGDFGEISGRKIFLKKIYKNIQLVIFDGNHEMLADAALDDLLMGE